MAFIRNKGKTKVMFMPVTTSTAITKGSLVQFSSGLLIAATSSTIPGLLEGVLVKTIAATDADYATARSVAVEVPVEKHVVWESDVTATLVVGDIGAEVDLTDANNVNRGASSIKIAKCVSFISTTKGLFYLKFGGSY